MNVSKFQEALDKFQEPYNYHIKIIKLNKLENWYGTWIGNIKYKITCPKDPKATETWTIWLFGNKSKQLNIPYVQPMRFEHDSDWKCYACTCLRILRDINLNSSYQTPNGDWGHNSLNMGRRDEVQQFIKEVK